MGDTRVNEEVPFTLDRMTGMNQNPEDYRAEPTKNEVTENIIASWPMYSDNLDTSQ